MVAGDVNMPNDQAARKKRDKFKGKPDGRIGRLDVHTLGYYRRVSDTLQEGFENADDKGKPISPLSLVFLHATCAPPLLLRYLTKCCTK